MYSIKVPETRHNTADKVFPLRLARFERPTNDHVIEIISEYFLCDCAESKDGT